MTHHLYPFSDERSYFFDSMYDHNRLCHGSKTFFRQPNKDQVQLESMFTKIQVLLSVKLGAEVHSVRVSFVILLVSDNHLPCSVFNCLPLERGT